LPYVGCRGLVKSALFSFSLARLSKYHRRIHVAVAKDRFVKLGVLIK
jgi:hypothetical protein